ncbi:hypothetical protein MNBD_DELTA03-12 [hydrothermal vent metagenome]|uniref:Glycosyl transferase family 1 domain-containing protein n=1 Tax=hydrothermal vent metagenome TaxID=652676 RepID=A0A3B0VL51_9ZZZZ
MSIIRHLLIYEPRLGGHHLTWLRYVTEDFLRAGLALTLAVDLRPDSRKLLDDKFADLADRLTIVSAYSKDKRYKGGSKMASLLLCLEESGAEEVFLTNFDEIASATLRRAAIGMMPPRTLRGKINGIYFRPRFMAECRTPGNIIKQAGFSRLSAKGWLNNIYLLDEYLLEKARNKWRRCNLNFLPDVWSGDYSHDRERARQELAVPAAKFVYLNYGIGTKRKGLHLIIKAMRNFKPSDNIFLLCAGKITSNELRAGVLELERKGLARVLNRYVTDTEEELCFSACDAVLLPYVRHFGSSGVLSRAAAAGKMVVASDEGLVARRVSEHDLGMLFNSGRASSLRETLILAARLNQSRMAKYKINTGNFASSCSRDKFSQALIQPFLCEDTAGNEICS